jgi:peptidyl-prolyl cis-trans isomerase C
MLGRVLREPLVHFLAAGGLLFAVYKLAPHVNATAPSDRTIVVDDSALRNFLQYRSKAFETEYFTSELNAMTPEQRKELADQYVEEEMMYREAKALGLEQGDYVIRQRLVQKMRFLMEDLVDTESAPTDAVLTDYLERNKARYLVQSSTTFTHVFVDASVHGDAAARASAARMKTQLNARHAHFTDAPQYGDRFPFLQNYVERTSDYVASQFGEEFVGALAKVPVSDTTWAGPLKSTHGYHLVLVTGRAASRLPTLAEIRQQVQEDWALDRSERARSQAMKQLSSQYRVDRQSK